MWDKFGCYFRKNCNISKKNLFDKFLYADKNLRNTHIILDNYVISTTLSVEEKINLK